jgi:ankyrin repeat protein
LQTWIKLLESNDFIGIKKYIKSGADVNEVNEQEESVLAIALRSRCDQEIIDMLIESGADLSEVDEEGVSIFDYTITYNNMVLFQKFLDNKIDVNHTLRKSRFTPLMAAICYSRSEMAEALIKCGANKEAVDFKGFKAVDFARKMNKKNMLKLLED